MTVFLFLHRRDDAVASDIAALLLTVPFAVLIIGSQLALYVIVVVDWRRDRARIAATYVFSVIPCFAHAVALATLQMLYLGTKWIMVRSAHCEQR